MVNKEKIRKSVRDNYSNIAKGGGRSCCVEDIGCTPISDINEASRIRGYTDKDLEGIPVESNMGLGCGNPVAIASLTKGETVLDLGSGGGLDSFLARKKVGETGMVIGVDMTPEMLELARENAVKAGYDNVEFRLGEIEHLPVANDTVDVIISNCVINLSVEKQKVFNEAYRVLKRGGRLSISDVVATAEMPEDVKNDLASISNCIGGAEHIDDLRDMLKKAGFVNIRITPVNNSREIIQSRDYGENPEDFVASYIIEGEK